MQKTIQKRIQKKKIEKKYNIVDTEGNAMDIEDQRTESDIVEEQKK